MLERVGTNRIYRSSAKNDFILQPRSAVRCASCRSAASWRGACPRATRARRQRRWRLGGVFAPARTTSLAGFAGTPREPARHRSAPPPSALRGVCASVRRARDRGSTPRTAAAAGGRNASCPSLGLRAAAAEKNAHARWPRAANGCLAQPHPAGGSAAAARPTASAGKAAGRGSLSVGSRALTKRSYKTRTGATALPRRAADSLAAHGVLHNGATALVQRSERAAL
jgi:hypothetical protein